MKTKTVQKENIRCIIFREKGVWYGVAVDLNIVETADTPREALLLLFEAVSGYLEAAKKAKIDITQKTDPEYERMWQSLNRGGKKREKVFFFGNLNIAKSDPVFA
jgi:hypothetical protein